MVDPIKTVVDRVCYWAEVNNPNFGKAELWTTNASLRVEFKHLYYNGEIYPFEYKPTTLQTSVFENNSSLPNKQTFSVNQKTVSTFTYTFKESFTGKISAKVKLPIFGESGLEPSLNLESTQSQTTTTERTWSYSADVNVGARKKVVTSFMVYEGKYSIPFTSVVQVRGHMCIAFWDVRKSWHGDVQADLIDQLNWNPATFDCSISGIFEARHGDKYVVNVNESDIGPKDILQPTLAVVDSTLLFEVNNMQDAVHSHERCAAHSEGRA